MADILKEYESVLPPGMVSRMRDELGDKVSDSKLKSVFKRLVEEYGQMKVHPGESVGIVAAESIGEPGTQMSLDYNEKVFVKSKKGVKSFCIGEFIDGILTNYGWKRLDNAGQTEVFEL